MGTDYRLKCADCDYFLDARSGYGKMHTRSMVFYGAECELPPCGSSDRVETPKGRAIIRSLIAKLFQKPVADSGQRRNDAVEPLLNRLIESDKVKREAFSLLRKGAVPSHDYGYELYICPACCRLSSRFYFRLQLKDESVYEPEYLCSCCYSSFVQQARLSEHGEWLRLTDEKGNDYHWRCPQCGGDRLEYDKNHLILWD